MPRYLRRTKYKNRHCFAHQLAFHTCQASSEHTIAMHGIQRLFIKLAHLGELQAFSYANACLYTFLSKINMSKVNIYTFLSKINMLFVMRIYFCAPQISVIVFFMTECFIFISAPKISVFTRSPLRKVKMEAICFICHRGCKMQIS